MNGFHHVKAAHTSQIFVVELQMFCWGQIGLSPQVSVQQQSSSGNPQIPNTALDLKRVDFIAQDVTVIIVHIN